jgi:hypothetical protein
VHKKKNRSEWEQQVRNSFSKVEHHVETKYGGSMARQGQIEETKLWYPYKITFCRKGYCKKLHFFIKISLVQWVVAWISHQNVEDARVPLPDQ